METSMIRIRANLPRVLVAGIGMTVLIGVVLAVLLFQGAPDSRPRPILLITIDTLRADALGVIGGGSQSPEFDRLAGDGLLFSNAVSAAPTTGPSHASILSGQFPWRHGYRNNGQVLSARTPMLAQLLTEAGYETGGFISGFPLNRMFGFDRGFAHYDDDFGSSSERLAAETTGRTIDWLRQVKGPRWFAWVHYFDPHTPYQAPPSFRQQGEHADYLGEVAYVDHWLGELVRAARAISPDVVIVITSDHGEGLGDHGELDHGLLLYQSTLRVPLLLIAPRVGATGLTSSLPVRSADIVPTLLSLVGVSASATVDGIDLSPLLHGKSIELPPAYSETYFGSFTYGWAPLRALREGNLKRIEGAYPRLFNLDTDPGEQRPVDSNAAGARLESLLAAIPDTEPATSTASPVASEAMRRLQSLGYLGAGGTDDNRSWDAGIDPEDRIAEHSQVWTAQMLLDDGDAELAEARFRAIAQLSPDNRVAWLRLGAIAFAHGRLDEAAINFQTAVALDPLNAEAQYQLAGVLTSQRRYRDAAHHWAEVTRLQPTRAVAWSNLGAVLLMDDQTDASIAALTEAVRLSPGSAELRENLARAKAQVLPPPD